MSTSIRLFSFGTALLVIGTAMAQAPYTLTVTGQFAGCTPGAMVVVQTLPGTLPSQSVAVPVNVECGFQAVLGLTSATGGVFAYATCANGTAAGDSSAFSFLAPATDSASVDLDLACGAMEACQACLSVAQAGPFTASFTSCSSGGVPPYTTIWLMPDGTLSIGASVNFTFGQAGIYGICMQVSDATGGTSVACDTVFVADDGSINNAATTPDCQAGFWVLQAYEDTSSGGGMVAPIPNEVWVMDLSMANDEIDQYAWDFGDGASSAENYPTHVYDGPGPWLLCLTITNGNCTNSFCDSVSVDENGILNGMIVDPHGTVGTSSNNRDDGFTLNVVPTLPTGIHEGPAFTRLKLWPNPVQEELNISFSSATAGRVPLAITDLAGRAVITGTYPLANGTNHLRLSTANLAPGTYVVRIGDAARISVVRFMKLR